MQCDWCVPTVQLSVFRSEVCFRPEDGSSMFLRNTDTNTLAYIMFHSQNCHDRKLNSNFLNFYSNGLYLSSPLEYNIKELYILTKDILFCLKINSTLHTTTLGHNMKLFMIQQLPSQPHLPTITNQYHRSANTHHTLTCLSVPSINTAKLYVTNCHTKYRYIKCNVI